MTEINYETFCRYGALQNPRLSQSGGRYYYTGSGPLYRPLPGRFPSGGPDLPDRWPEHEARP